MHQFMRVITENIPAFQAKRATNCQISNRRSNNPGHLITRNCCSGGDTAPVLVCHHDTVDTGDTGPGGDTVDSVAGSDH